MERFSIAVRLKAVLHVMLVTKDICCLVKTKEAVLQVIQYGQVLCLYANVSNQYYVIMYVCVYVCMCVCMYVYICT